MLGSLPHKFPTEVGKTDQLNFLVKRRQTLGQASNSQEKSYFLSYNTKITAGGDRVDRRLNNCEYKRFLRMEKKLTTVVYDLVR